MPPFEIKTVGETVNVGDMFKDAKNGQMVGRGKKRTRESDSHATDSVQKKKKVHHPCHQDVAGVVLICGEGDVGQLGLGEDVMEKARPTLVDIPDKIIQVCGGGMHTVCLTEKGEVYTFGCNDEGTLGRDTSEDGAETRPGKVEGLPRIVMVSGGDSHTAALSEEGKVYIWGNFRDANGHMGLTEEGVKNKPHQILADQEVIKIASGGDHLVCLTSHGEVYTCGCAEQGQLGRVAECFSQRGGRKGLSYILHQAPVHFRSKKCFIEDVFVGQYATFAKDRNGDIYSWGLNNYYQLGFGDMKNRFVPEKVKAFSKKNFVCVASGQHHSVTLDNAGNVYTFGRSEYGRLGLGENCTETKEPTLVKLDKKCIQISASNSVSFALLEDGTVSCWGMGTSKQLGNGSEDDAWLPTKMDGKQLQDRKVIQVSSGGQHTVLLAVEK